MVTGRLVLVDGVEHYRIEGIQEMDPFLTTVASDTDLWMFASSTGVVTAGRRDADHALFPYETDDRLHRAAGYQGPVTVIARSGDGRRELWRPFKDEPTPGCTRSIAKAVLGDRLIFEERNDWWGITFRATWAPSAAHGWVRSVELVDDGHDGARLEVLDGLLDVMPAGVDELTEQRRSNLADAYKRSEAGPWGRLAVYSLESLITDRAEPAESLTAATVWSVGFDGAQLDLDRRGLAAMIDGRPVAPRLLLTGRPGAYLLRGQVDVPRSGSASWLIVADTARAHPDVEAGIRTAADRRAAQIVLDDVGAGSVRLRHLLAGADGFQSTVDHLADAHHLSNVLFNSMRGGLFPYGHRVPTADLADFLVGRNRDVGERLGDWVGELDEWVDVGALRAAALETGDDDLTRLVLEYLPLTFSRRHGDPSRPWNRFSIHVRNDDGSELLWYEGNWRDIFQNWEALLHSYPAFFAHVVAKFVNASTIDGYNPYRISRSGIDWEVPDPDDPWSQIGYWGDHQIVYLLRILESWERYEPGAIRTWLQRRVFVYADVPYTIADHEAMVRDPRHTVSFDEQRSREVAGRVERIGADGQLVVDADGQLLRVGLLEKLLVSALGKLTAFVPDGGIWLNTQRPEWNDANNALAGPGLSMVTLYHLHRYLSFVIGCLDGTDSVTLTSPVAGWLTDLLGVFERFPATVAPIDDRTRRSFVDDLGAAGTEFRRRVRRPLDQTTIDVPAAEVERLLTSAAEHIEQSIRRAVRDDGLYHSYNLVSFPAVDEAHVAHLGPMLEGQVAVLSSGALDPHDAVALIDALFASDLYRADQETFLLYPPIELPPFLARNHVPAGAASKLLRADGTLDDGLRRVFTTDGAGRVWFQPDLTNASRLQAVFDDLHLPAPDRQAIADLYEQVFDHASFTGRSARMYGYEGIGSVYWHMVGKLLLAVQEAYSDAVDGGAPDDVIERLRQAYRRIRSGLGFVKQPAEFGAFPIDCYSHTPAHAGAQQPGMTGQVKEQVLTRLGELGVRVRRGRISLEPGLLPRAELIGLADAADGPARASFTFASVQMNVEEGEADGVTIHRDGAIEHRDELTLTVEQSAGVFARNGSVTRVDWTIAALPPTPPTTSEAVSGDDGRS